MSEQPEVAQRVMSEQPEVAQRVMSRLAPAVLVAMALALAGCAGPEPAPRPQPARRPAARPATPPSFPDAGHVATYRDETHAAEGEGAPADPAMGGDDPAEGGDPGDPSDTGDLVDDLSGARDRMRGRVRAAGDKEFFSNNLSDDEEQAMGLGVASRVASDGLVGDEALLRYLNLVGAHLAECSDRPFIPYRIHVLDEAAVNAVACPGGYIFVTVGALRAMEAESELAGVLAHEIAHVALKHGVRELDRMGHRIAARGAAAEMDRSLEKYYGPMDPETAALVAQLDQVADLHYQMATGERQRELEAEADRFAVRYLVRSGWDPSGLARFLGRLGGARTLGKSWGSHPSPASRVAAVEEEIRRSGGDGGATMKERFLRYTDSLRG
ncbi:MAG: M48 family metalloprotease [Planctomycetes bacterium]|nr:M48 family metalloprotease [Planctomycetota bacterium]